MVLADLCPRTAPISKRDAPLAARKLAVVCLISCHLKSLIPAFLKAVAHALLSNIGFSGLDVLGKINRLSLSGRTLAL